MSATSLIKERLPSLLADSLGSSGVPRGWVLVMEVDSLTYDAPELVIVESDALPPWTALGMTQAAHLAAREGWSDAINTESDD